MSNSNADESSPLHHWNAPHLSLHTDHGMKQKTNNRSHSIRPRKSRRKLFRLFKERGRKAKATIISVDDDQDGFRGFQFPQQENPRYHRGFLSNDVYQSLIRYIQLQSYIDSNFLEAPTRPVQCISIPLEPAAKPFEFTLQVIPWQRRRLRCLSLFDGVSSALHVLRDKLHLDLEAYFASEIDECALAVQRKNFYGQVINLGDVQSITRDTLNCLGRIDLLVGGSPCNELSRVNFRRKGLFDYSGSGALFFKFLEIRNFLQAKAVENDTPFYWLLENTSHMDSITKLSMAHFLQCTPREHCPSEKYVPMKRRRLFFGNIPSLPRSHSRNTSPPPLHHFFKPYCRPCVSILPTLTTNSISSQRCGPSKSFPVLELEQRHRGLTVTEVELLLGFPAHYTDTGRLSSTARLKLLGRSWSIPVVTEILRNLPFMYECLI